MKLLTKLTSIFDRTIGVFAGAAGVILLFLVASICSEIVLRYFLNRPLAWVLQTSEISLLYITFLGAAWVLKREGHVRVDILVNQLRPQVLAVLGAITSIMGAVVCLVLIWYGVQVTWDHFVRGLILAETPHFPTAPVLAIIPIGSFLFFIQFLRQTRKYLGERRAPPEQAQRL